MANLMNKILDEMDRTDELLHKSLKEINDAGDLNPAHLEMLGDVLDGILDSCKIHNMIEPYSGNSYYMPYDRSYDRGYRSYNRSYNDRSYDRSYNDRSYGDQSYEKDAYIANLERQMMEAKSEQEKDVIRRLIRDRESQMR